MSKPEDVIRELEEIKDRLGRLLDEVKCPLCEPDIVIAMAYVQKIINTYVMYASTYENVVKVMESQKEGE